MEKHLLTLLQQVREDGDDAARAELNELLRSDAEARRIMADELVDEQAMFSLLRDQSLTSILEFDANAKTQPRVRSSRQPLITAVAAGLALGMVCMAVASEYFRPRLKATVTRVAAQILHRSPVGQLPNGVPIVVNEWGANPSELVMTDSGPRLHFLTTDNITGNPDGGASGCNAFYFVDLRPIQQEIQRTEGEDPIIKLSAVFEREESTNPAHSPNSRGTLDLMLFDVEPEDVAKNWPSTSQLALGKSTKRIQVEPGMQQKLGVSCVLPPEATVALIRIGATHGLGPGAGQTDVSDWSAGRIKLVLVQTPVLPTTIVE
jgi:hypothetical protein